MYNYLIDNSLILNKKKNEKHDLFGLKVIYLQHYCKKAQKLEKKRVMLKNDYTLWVFIYENNNKRKKHE